MGLVDRSYMVISFLFIHYSHFTEKGSKKKVVMNKEFYPNSDLTVWLRSCKKEVEKSIEGVLYFGKIPKCLNGILIQNGPGGIDLYEDDEACNHLFDGPGLLQKFNFFNGRVNYTNRFIRSHSYKCNVKARRLVISEFGTIGSIPSESTLQRWNRIFRNGLKELMSDNANISITPFGSEIYSLAETPFAHKINLTNLHTIKTIDILNQIGLLNQSSHPHIEGSTVYNIGQTWSLLSGPQYLIIEMKENENPWESGIIRAKVPCRWPFHFTYSHSFSITPNYFILIEQPLTLPIRSMLFNFLLWKQPIKNCLQFFESENTLIHLIRRDSNEIRSFTAPPFFFFHTINAYEEEERVIVDICTYKNPLMIDCMLIEALKGAHSNPNYADNFRSKPMRFILNVGNKNDNWAEMHEIVNIGCEVPRTNYEKWNGKPYKYFYAISSDVDLKNPGILIKVNVREKSYKCWYEANAYPSEPVVIPSFNSHNEDDALILSTLLFGGERTSGPNKFAVVILNAKNFECIGKVMFESEGAIPKCLHGSFIPKKKLKKIKNKK